MAYGIKGREMNTWYPGCTMEQVKICAIHDALVHFKGNKMHAAKALQISVRTIRNHVYDNAQLKKFYVMPVYKIAKKS